jgi:hypothetical protein
MVKDLRTGVERSDPQKVLEGDLDEFMAASLAARVVTKRRLSGGLSISQSTPRNPSIARTHKELPRSRGLLISGSQVRALVPPPWPDETEARIDGAFLHSELMASQVFSSPLLGENLPRDPPGTHANWMYVRLDVSRGLVCLAVQAWRSAAEEGRVANHAGTHLTVLRTSLPISLRRAPVGVGVRRGMVRAAIKPEIETAILVKSRRRCCICFGLNHVSDIAIGQIAHLDRDSSNSSEDNLAFMCLEHHDWYDSSTSQSKGPKVAEAKVYRDELYSAMAIAAKALPAVEPPKEEVEPPEPTRTMNIFEVQVRLVDAWTKSPHASPDALPIMLYDRLRQGAVKCWGRPSKRYAPVVTTPWPLRRFIAKEFWDKNTVEDLDEWMRHKRWAHGSPPRTVTKPAKGNRNRLPCYWDLVFDEDDVGRHWPSPHSWMAR